MILFFPPRPLKECPPPKKSTSYWKRNSASVRIPLYPRPPCSVTPLPHELEERFIAAYEAYADAIFRHIALRLGDRERGKEIMQETFLRAWEFLAQGNSVHNLRAFLYRVAQNLLVDYARRRKLRTEESLETLEEQGLELPAEEWDPHLALDAERVMNVLQHIDEHNRAAVVLRYVDGLPPREIAALLGISANAASVRIHRGLEQLRSFLTAAHG